MAHIIQPLDIEGTLYCVAYHGGRATRGVATSLQITPTNPPDVSDPDSPWNAPIDGVASETEISFGVGCGTEVQLSFETDGTGGDYTIDVNVYVNGVLYTDGTPAPVTIHTPDTSAGITIDLTDYPCGNLITLVISLTDDETGTPLNLGIAITSIT